MKGMTAAGKRARISSLKRQKTAMSRRVKANEKKVRAALDAMYKARQAFKHGQARTAERRLNKLSREANNLNRMYQAIDVKIKDLQGKPVSSFQRATARRRD